MRKLPKTTQMQIRVSATEKAAIQRAASRAGMDMSAYVLAESCRYRLLSFVTAFGTAPIGIASICAG